MSPVNPVLELVLKATVLLALALLLEAVVLRRASGRLKHGVWCTALLALVLLPLTLLAPPLLSVTVRTHPPAPSLPQGRGEAVIATTTSVTPQVPAPRESESFPWESLLTVGYFIGVGGLLGRLLLDRAQLFNLARRATLASSVHFPCDFPVHLSPAVPTPLAAGGRTGVLLPDSAHDWDTERRHVILLHEAAHLRRLDHITLPLALSLQAAWWFHPLVWLAISRFRTAAEAACDEAVVAAGVSPSTYAEHLLETAKSLKLETTV
ncbi:M56 family metallopeptidase [Armatimonas sp.]|uniref:M56 family metallopeptidase n=1 Tax=Armatimonas sp. TaxID=1872638 RepID=UPI00374FDF44